MGKDSYRVKVVNSKTKPISTMAKNVRISLGAWKGFHDFIAVPLDDFDVILGIKFLMKVRVAVLPHLCGLMIGDPSQPDFMQGQHDNGLDDGEKFGQVSAFFLFSSKYQSCT